MSKENNKKPDPFFLYYLVFQIDKFFFSISSQDIKKVIHLPELSRPVGMPWLLEGLLNFGGELVPVVKLSLLLSLPETKKRLFTPIILLRGKDGLSGFIVDSVRDIIPFSKAGILPIEQKNIFNKCVVAKMEYYNREIMLLDKDKVFLENERIVIKEFKQISEERLEKLKEPITDTTKGVEK